MLSDKKKMVELENKLWDIIKQTDLTFPQVFGVLESLKFRIKEEIDKAWEKDVEKRVEKLIKGEK